MKKMNTGGMAHDQLMHGINAKEKMPKMPKGMKKGGPTSMDRKNLGRNMSRVKNQRGR